MSERPRPGTRAATPGLVLTLALLGAGMIFVYWPTLRAMAGRWVHDPRYTHGWLVAPFSAYLLWSRRPLLASGPSGWGAGLIAAAMAMRLAGTYAYSEWIEGVSLLPALAGIAVLAGGWPTLRRSAGAIGFLIFMIPLPNRLEVALGGPLQRLGTIVGTYGLQTFGLPALAEGNVISVGEARIGVVEACNGLGMLYTFLAITTGAALLGRRPPLDKALIILSAVPIALAVNVARITATGLLFVTAGDRIAHAVYHDLAGWLMMPMALAAIWVEGALLSRLLVDEGTGAPGPFAPLVPSPVASRGPVASARPVQFPMPVGDASPRDAK